MSNGHTPDRFLVEKKSREYSRVTQPANVVRLVPRAPEPQQSDKSCYRHSYLSRSRRPLREEEHPERPTLACSTAAPQRATTRKLVVGICNISKSIKYPCCFKAIARPSRACQPTVWTLSLICQSDFDRESQRHSGASLLWETSVILEDPVAFVGHEDQIRGHDLPAPRA